MTPARLRTVSHVTVREGGSDRADWRKRGWCIDWAGWPADPWYPTEGSTSADPEKRAAAYAYARNICDHCPVEKTCLEDALAREWGYSALRHGMRGGKDPIERAKIARSRTRKAKQGAGPINHGTEAGAKAHSRRGEKACPECLRGAARTHRWRIAEQHARKAGTT